MTAMASHDASSPLITRIKGFWQWFRQNQSQITHLYSAKNFNDLSTAINREIDRVDVHLAWEIGPGRRKPHLFTISSEGNLELRYIAEQMIGLAPELTEWEFYSSRPPRQPAARVTLPERGIDFDTSTWRFVPVERPDKGRLDLLILDEKLGLSEREASLKAVSIYLDQLLGEETVETWIGKFEIESPTSPHHEKAYEMSDLPNYLYRAIHRETNPLRYGPRERIN